MSNFVSDKTKQKIKRAHSILLEKFKTNPSFYASLCQCLNEDFPELANTPPEVWLSMLVGTCTTIDLLEIILDDLEKKQSLRNN